MKVIPTVPIGSTFELVPAGQVRPGQLVLVRTANLPTKRCRLLVVVGVTRFDFDAREQADRRGRAVQPAATYVVLHLAAPEGATRPLVLQLAATDKVVRYCDPDPPPQQAPPATGDPDPAGVT